MLSNEEILKAREEGFIVIEPFELRNLGTNSYDVVLGEYYYREHRAKADRGEQWYNIYDEREVNEVWGKPEKAFMIDLGVYNTYHFLKSFHIGDRIILIAPGETILAHTNEFIGGRAYITSMMKARSSFGRNFIEVCKCAGLGDVGYVNRWTMEITNNSRFYNIPLVVGRRIAQITFFNTGASFDYAEQGKYQETSDLEKLKAGWKPEMMLPRLFRDYEVLENG